MLKKILIAILVVIALIVLAGLYLFYMHSTIGKVILYTFCVLVIVATMYWVYRIVKKRSLFQNIYQTGKRFFRYLFWGATISLLVWFVFVREANPKSDSDEMTGLQIIILIVAGVLSLTLTAITVAATLYIKNKSEIENNNDVKDLWQWFGYCSETPKLIRAVVTGMDEKNGPITSYIFAEGTYDKKNKTLVYGDNPYQPLGPIDKLVWKKFGKRRFGTPIFSSLRPLNIDRVVPVDSIKSAKAEVANMLEQTCVRRYGLKETIYRPTLHIDLDTKEGKRFSVVSYATLRVFDPEPAFTIYKDNFLQTLSEQIGGFLSKRALTMTWDEYKATGKDFNKEELKKLSEDLKILGINFQNLTMSDPELNKTIQETMELRFKAQEAAAAKREQGEGERDYAISIGEGTARVTERNAIANRRRFEELIALFRGRGMSDVAATKEAIETILRTQDAEAVSKLTNYVTGSNAGIVLNPGDKKQ